jgi:hypothetical protein
VGEDLEMAAEEHSTVPQEVRHNHHFIQNSTSGCPYTKGEKAGLDEI